MTHSALKIQRILNAEGYKTLAAGGFVRDYLMARAPKDIDLATQAKPYQMIEVFNKYDIKYIETGIKHGTLTVIMGPHSIEVTTLRIDRDCDGRHAEVEFTDSFEVDASRRDFTINAMFMDLETYEIFDYFGGKKDIKDKVIKFVGDPEERIKEDYLRILRAYRFSSTLGFVPDYPCRVAIEKYENYLVFISPERIREEVLKMIVGEYAFMFSGWVPVVLPEIRPCIGFKQNNAHHAFAVADHILKVVKKLPKKPLLRFAGLMHDIAKPLCYSEDEHGRGHFYEHHEAALPLVDRICDRLKFSNKDKEYIKFIVKNHMRFAIGNDINKRVIRKLLRECEEFGDRNVILDLLSFRKADLEGQSETPRVDKMERHDKLVRLVHEVMDEMPKIKSPLDGREIMAITGITEGKKIGEIKEYLISCVENGFLKPEDKAKAQGLMEMLIKMEYDNKYRTTL